MDNASLCKLIREALHSPEKAEALALAIDHLPEVMNLGRRWFPYEEEALLEEALLKTRNYIRLKLKDFPARSGLQLENINCHNPNDAEKVKRKFIIWAKMILKGDCRDAKKKNNSARKRYPEGHPVISSMNKPLGKDNDGTLEDTISNQQTLNPNQIPSLDLLAELIAKEELIENEKNQIIRFRLFEGSINHFTERVTEKLNPFFESLAACHPSKAPQANCYELIKRRLFQKPPQKWKDIVQELQIPFGNVTSHWKRKCEPLLLNIEESLEN